MRLNLDLQPFERKKVSYYAPSPFIFLFLLLFTVVHYSFQTYKAGNSYNLASKSLSNFTKEYQSLISQKNILQAKKNSVTKLIRETNSLKHRLSLQKLSWYTLFIQLEKTLPNNTSLDSLSFSKENIRAFTVTGKAAKLEDIIKFTENLLTNKYFEDVVIVNSKQFKPENYNKNIYSFEITCKFLG